MKKVSWTPEQIRNDFPILSAKTRNGKRLTYLDHAATSQKPKAVIDRMDRYYREENANVHRGIYELSEKATTAYEGVRPLVARFLGDVRNDEIIFTSGTTASINLVANSWGRKNISPGDVVAVTRMEHHANFVPWQSLCIEKGAIFKIVELDSEGCVDPESFAEVLKLRPKIFALTWMSNVLGVINPVEVLAERAKEVGACVVLDAAQGVAHLPVSSNLLRNVDFLAFSAHKVCGPTGVGVLWGRRELLENMPPVQFGGDMISRVSDLSSSWNEVPWKFEPGTPPIAGVIGMGEALQYVMALGMHHIEKVESDLTLYTLNHLSALEGVRVFGPKDPQRRGGVFSFEAEGVHPHDMATFMDSYGIAVRAGHHCAQPLMKWLGVSATTRASLSFVSTQAEIDVFLDAVREAVRFFGKRG